MMDIITIKNIELETLVGVLPEERTQKRLVKINIRLFCDLRKAGQSDSLDDTVDYRNIELKIHEKVTKNQYLLIERIAEETAEICLADDGVEKVNVSVEKAGTLAYSESATVEIER